MVSGGARLRNPAMNGASLASIVTEPEEPPRLPESRRPSRSLFVVGKPCCGHGASRNREGKRGSGGASARGPERGGFANESRRQGTRPRRHGFAKPRGEPKHWKPKATKGRRGIGLRETGRGRRGSGGTLAGGGRRGRFRVGATFCAGWTAIAAQGVWRFRRRADDRMAAPGGLGYGEGVRTRRTVSSGGSGKTWAPGRG